MDRRPTDKAIAAMQNETLQGILRGRPLLQALGFAMFMVTKQTGRDRADVIAVIDTILPANWREIAALPNGNTVEPIDDLHARES